MNLDLKILTMIAFSVKIINVWHGKCKFFKWDFWNIFVLFHSLQFRDFFLVCLQNTTVRIKSVFFGQIILRVFWQIKTNSFRDWIGVIFRSRFKSVSWKWKNSKWKIWDRITAISRAIPERNENLYRGIVRAHFRLPLKRFWAT